MRRLTRKKTILTRARISAALVVFLSFSLVQCNDSIEQAESSNQPTQLDSLNARIIDSPNDPQAYHDRALYYSNYGQPQRAFEDWGLALKADSTFAPAWEQRVDMLYRMQNFDGCMDELNSCIRLAPQSTECRLLRAEFYVHLNQFERAFEDLNSALRIDNQLHEAYWMKGKIYASQNDQDKAISSYQTAIEVNPEFFDGYISLGIYLAGQQNPLAEEFYRSAIELRPSSIEAKYNLAIFYQNSEQYRDALGLYREILAIDSTNATASFNQGFIHLEYYAQYDSAVFWFSEAIEHLPYYHQAFFNRGLALESMGETEAALSDYSEALRLKPDYTSAALAKERALKSFYNRP